MQHGRGRRPTTKISLRFPSPDARLRGTGGDAGGWQGISGGRLRSVWPTAEDRRGCEGIGGDSLGLVCKIAGNAYPGSNPGPATPILTCGNAASAGLGYPGRVCQVFLRFPPRTPHGRAGWQGAVASGVPEQADSRTNVAVQIARTNSPNASATRRLVGASTASS